MNKKIMYGILIIFLIVLIALAYFVIAKKLAKTNLDKTKNTAVVLTKEQVLEKVTQEMKVRQAERDIKIQEIKAKVDQMVKEDLARRAKEAALPAIVTSSPELNDVNIKPVK